MKIQNLPRKFYVKTKQLWALGAPRARTRVWLQIWLFKEKVWPFKIFESGNTDKFSHQIYRQNNTVKNFSEIKNHRAKPRIDISCVFSSYLRRWNIKRRTWVLTFVSVVWLWSRDSQDVVFCIYFWFETVTYDIWIVDSIMPRPSASASHKEIYTKAEPFFTRI